MILIHARFLSALGLAALVGSGSTTFAQGVTAGSAMPLAAHRAVYDLTLGKASGSKAPSSARGRIAFDFTGSACEGYVMNFRQLTELQPPEGAARVSDMRSATFEDGEGKSYRFKVQTLVDARADEDLDGRARKLDGGDLSVDMSKPKRAKIELDKNVLFPTEHLKRIVAAAKGGDKTLEVKVYDGSETGEKVYETLTVIGREIAAEPTEAAARIDALKSVRRWPVAISYFDAAKKDEAPNYVLSFDLYENGISRALKLDYGDFTLAGEMTKLDILPAAKCDK